MIEIKFGSNLHLIYHFLFTDQIDTPELNFLYLYQNISAVEKKCLDCGDSLRGRTDKKFCSDQCRNSYNNKLAADGKITFTQAAEAVDVLTRAMNDAAQSRVDRALNEFFGDIDEEARKINDLSKEMTSLKYTSLVAGEMIAGSFEDAILSGRALGDVLRSLGQDLLRLVFQQSITAPLASAITGGITGFFGGARAAGGPVGTGSSYLVGENGPELFVPSTAGRIMNEHQMGGGGGGGGTVVNLNYNIASGVTRAELKPILEQQRAQLKREIPDAVRRGGSYRTAFA